MKSLTQRWDVIYPRMVTFKDWYKIVSPVNKLYRIPFTLHLRNGEVFAVRDAFCSDISIILDVFYNDEYHLENFSLPENAVVIDAGANIGAFASFIQYLFPTARVYAYEPEPDNFNLLVKNAPNAHSFQNAVTGKEEDIELYLNVDTTGHTLVRGNVNPNKKDVTSITVKGIPLQKILEQFDEIGILKLDIEGSEYDAVLNADPAQLKKVKNLFLEIHSSWSDKTPQDLLDYLTGIGFEIKKKEVEVYWLTR